MSTPPPVTKPRGVLRGPETSRKRIGREIAQVRKTKGFTQSSLAAQIGSSRRTISRVENGEPGIALDTYAAISELIGPLENFWHEANPPKPDIENSSNWTAL